MSDRWRGLISLTVDALDHGSRSIERVHKETVARPLRLLSAIPGLERPTIVATQVHDTLVGAAYTSVRAVGTSAGALANAVLDVLQR